MKSNSHNNNIKRDGETPRAMSGNMNLSDKAESYPVSSGSVQGLRRSLRLAGRQAGTVKLATAKGLKGSLFVRESELVSQVERPSHSRNRSKTFFEEKQQDQHHSSVSNSNRESSFDDFASSSKPFYQHKSRDSNLRNEVNYTRKAKIMFPGANDSRWNEWNSELKSLLSKHFGFKIIRALGSTELSEKFDSFIYDFFVKKLGDEAFVGSNEKKKSKKYENKRMKRLRIEKKNCKKAFKALVRAGLGDGEEAQILKKRWHSLVRQHNKLRVSLEYQKKQKAKSAAEKRFKNNPYGFAQNLFEGQKKKASPTFSKEKCEEYFCNLYRDPGRDHVYDFLPELKRPLNPADSSSSFKFSLSVPTLDDLMKSVLKKRNGACPGFNGLSYLPYKRCPVIMEFLHKIICKIWKSQDIPEDWARAFVVLLQKSDDVLDDPSEFRPIAITNTVGKIFFSVISSRLQFFMVNNNFIKRETQKGFLFGMPGCVEHSFALWEALKNASAARRQIVVSWIDLANAYGSVRHNLIQFALNWYHVPIFIQKLIFNYYEKLCAQVLTKSWSTGCFFFDIGLFQGCVLSTILFDCVFNLLLDFLEPLEDLGYAAKWVSLSSKLIKAYADDLTLLTKTSQGNQIVLNRAQIWLKWSETMKAKPKKCVCVGFKVFGPMDKSDFTPLKETLYSPFDPKLMIAGERFKFIFDPSQSEDSLKRSHFKFLGRWTGMNLKDVEVANFVQNQFLDMLDIVENAPINGLMKLWVYQHVVLSKISWPFMIYDFSLSFVKKLEAKATVFLKRWAGVFKKADPSILYRPRNFLGLQLTSLTCHFQKLQVCKCMLLENSIDPNIRSLYAHKAEKEKMLAKCWRASKFTTKVKSMAKHRIQFPYQSNNLGLGWGVYNPKPAPSEFRKMVTAEVHTLENERFMSHAVSLPLQGTWTNWVELGEPFDFSWNNLIYGPGTKLISFVLNSISNSVVSPYMLNLMGYADSKSCQLCQHSTCNIFHILANCSFSLKERYTWRHDSVLETLHPVLQAPLEQHNQSPQRKAKRLILDNFVKAGEVRYWRTVSKVQKNWLSNFFDWKLLVDFSCENIVFPLILSRKSM